ncbi:MAG: anti-sigma factor antagonist [Lachnospiraceae bacterium]|jgi:stage II sporulation protein AA (anti-sigma F factor antagonist)|nr:anti-sigma factor antagonist [Lachnospiraceae bacterium]
MEERFHIIDNYLMIRMPEEIDHHQASALSERADGYILREKIQHIVFDFEDTRFMDSSGVGVVMGRYKKIACFGGRVYAVNADRQIQRIIRVSGLKKVLHVVEEGRNAQ